MRSVYQLISGSLIPEPLVHLDAPMSGYTTFRVGGPADCLIDISSVKDLRSVLSFAREHALPVTVIGNGSNILVRDGGIRGIVLRISSLYSTINSAITGIGPSYGPSHVAVSPGNMDSPDSRVTIRADAGISLSSIAQYAASHGLAGFSPLSGIPGTLGGAVLMNAGAYGTEIGSLITEITVLSTDEDRILTFTHDDLAFGYRTSALMGSPYIVLSASLRLCPGDSVTIREEMQALALRRREKQPLEHPSAGSTFKRPAGAFAAKLIDDCGLRGFRIGDAQVSEKHCGFVVNRGKATAADILALMASIQDTVFNQTGYRLEPEIRILGED